MNFGLINQTYPGVGTASTTQWQQFEQVVDSLNANAGLDTVYKVFFLGRHGEGYHNAAESYYGTPAWNVSQVASNKGAQLTITVLLVNPERQRHLNLG